MQVLDEALEAHWREFGNYLQERIDRAKLSLTEFASKADITLVQASRIVNGQSGTRRTTLPRFVQALGLTSSEEIRELYEMAGFTPPPDVNRRGAMILNTNTGTAEVADEEGKGRPATLAEIEAMMNERERKLLETLQKMFGTNPNAAAQIVTTEEEKREEKD